ncbi:MAG: hypothetical protein R2825_06680 [Saprospiraceae bacterium]
MIRYLFLFPLFASIFACHSDQQSLWTVAAPAGERLCQINPNGETIIPNGRIIQPYGKTVKVAPHPYGLTLSHDGNHSGHGQF